MLQYAVLCGVVSALGIGLAMPALLVEQIVPDSFVVAFMACVIAFLILDNWTLAKDLQVRSQPIELYVATQSQHIRIIGEMSVQNSMLMSSNTRLAQDLQRFSNVSLEAMHWNLLAHKAMAMRQIENIHINRSLIRSHSM